jgi:hypothetical protein
MTVKDNQPRLLADLTTFFSRKAGLVKTCVLSRTRPKRMDGWKHGRCGPALMPRPIWIDRGHNKLCA